MTGAAGLLPRLERWARARPRVAVALALAAGPAFLLKDALLGGVLYARDIHLYWHAEAEAFVRAVAAGAWPVWDPTLGFGQPLLANASAEVLYPPTWLNLVMPPWRYYTLFVALHLLLSAAGAYAAGRRLGCSRLAAAAGAALWSACGPFVSLASLWHHFAGAAWLPWVLATALGLSARRTLRSALALAAVLALQVLAGSFDMAAMGMAVAGAVVACRLSWPRPWAAGPDRRLAALAAGAVVLALGLSAGQWVATLEVAARSGRRALPRETRTFWSLHPAAVADLALPGFTASGPVSPALRRRLFEGREPFLPSLYLGLAALGLACAGLADARKRDRLALAAAFVLALAVALGRYGPAYDLLVTLAPPLLAFRYPVKAMVVAALAWCLLAAFGVDAVRGGSVGRLPTWLALGLSAAGGLGALGLLVLGSGTAAVALAVAALFAAVAAIAAARAARADAPRTALAAAAALAAALDLLVQHRDANPVAPSALYLHRPEVLAGIPASADARVYAYDYAVPPAPGADPPGRILQRLARVPAGWPLGAALALGQQMSLTPLSASRWGLRGSFEIDNTGLFPVHVNQAAYLLRGVEGAPAHLRLLQMGAVTHAVAQHEGPFAGLPRAASFPGLFVAPILLFTVPDPMPRAYVVAGVRPGEGMFGLAALLDPAFDFRREVLWPGAAPWPAAGPASAARVTASFPDRMTLEVDAPAGGRLVVVESYDPGWRATVDGRPAAVVPANVLFRGIELPPGARVVELVYRPAGLIAGLWVSALSVLAAAVLELRTRVAREAP